jgi:HAD superfamily hydrolase (TIGR01484 family)
VFTDLDGTLTTKGSVAPSTLEALSALKSAGFWVVLVTGRPAGWADCLMNVWPIDAAIFENGAGYYWREGNEIQLCALAARENGPVARGKLLGLFEKVRNEIPHAELATDQAYRLFDFAINHSETRPHLSHAETQRVVEILGQEEGVTPRLSSTHVNYLFGDHTKATGIGALIEHLGKRRSIDSSQICFIGDSLNDEPVFAALPHTVGVANISAVWEQLSSRPKQVTKSHSGKGFEELAYCLLTL